MARKKQQRKKETAAMVVATNVSQAVDGLKKKSSPLFKIVERFTIVTVEDQKKLVAALKQIKAYGAEAKAQKTEKFDAPAKQILANSKLLFQPFLDSVDEALNLGKDKILAFVNSRVLKAAKVEKDFEDGKIKKFGTVVNKQTELNNNDNTRKIWTLTVVDEKKIPRAYLMPDETAIRAALKDGKKVAGCTWTQENTIAV